MDSDADPNFSFFKPTVIELKGEKNAEVGTHYLKSNDYLVIQVMGITGVFHVYYAQ